MQKKSFDQVGPYRSRLPFRSVNRRGSPQHDPALQRHHLLPRQLLTARSFAPMIAAIGSWRIGFDDFRRNGIMLPAREEAVSRLGLPLHRGPHRNYNAMVMARVGRIEHRWARERKSDPEQAAETALMRLALLQGALRKRFFDDRQPLRLNRKDPLRASVDFSDLDAMADFLWGAGAA